jgi:hypothetical protein
LIDRPFGQGRRKLYDRLIVPFVFNALSRQQGQLLRVQLQIRITHQNYVAAIGWRGEFYTMTQHNGTTQKPETKTLMNGRSINPAATPSKT